VPHPIELFIFICGYAFNPVMFPLWLSLMYKLSLCSLRNSAVTTDQLSEFALKWRKYSQSNMERAAIINTAVYFMSVLITLAITEVCKASFATTRPQSRILQDGSTCKQNHETNHGKRPQGIRRYGSLVSSLKSKHSFPSGDCAQATNLCMFLFRFVPASTLIQPSGNAPMLFFNPIRDYLIFGVFLPGVAFARVFYWCHWVEDCIGGIILVLLLHWFLIPVMGEKLIEMGMGL
jgi:membrane-associated phospholipid phosphatase